MTAATVGEATATQFRVERQMVHVINHAKETAVIQYLEYKRKVSQTL